jgi:carbonic anhydrase/acetyltransferase-like protein (isoleucine patch superfamily)
MAIVRCGDFRPVVHQSAFVAEGSWVIGDVCIGEGASVWFQSVLRADINSISIGPRSNIQDACILHVTNTFPVRIGRDVTVGHRAIVHGCTIGDESLIGMGAILLDGAQIGRNALIGAGALVPEKAVIPDGMLAVGIPAKIVRALSDEEKEQIRQSALHYVEYAQAFRT